MKKVLMLGNMMDKMSGHHIIDSLRGLSSKVAAVDTRRIVYELGFEHGQEIIINEISSISFKPDLIIVLKGLEMSDDTIDLIHEMYPEASLVNWFFDLRVRNEFIWDCKSYYNTIKKYDYYFCSIKGVADKLKQMGLNNALYLDQGCHPVYNGEIILNHFQTQKYGSDVSFIGSLGFMEIHKDRIPTLTKVANEGFRLKVWGNVLCSWKHISIVVKNRHTETKVINENFSKVVQSSLINLGLDAYPEVDCGWSARLFRVLCAGGLYLSTPTKGLSAFFNINKKGEAIKSSQHLVVFYDLDDLIDKLDFLLEHNDIRESIAKNGQKIVLDKHKISGRLTEMIEIIENDKRR